MDEGENGWFVWERKGSMPVVKYFTEYFTEMRKEGIHYRNGETGRLRVKIRVPNRRDEQENGSILFSHRIRVISLQ